MFIPIPGVSLGSLSRCQSCIAYTFLRLSTRPFSNTTILTKIGPESPKFIEIPESLQAEPRTYPVIRGTLPVPRNILDIRGHRAKASPQFIAAATLPPTAKHQLAAPSSDKIAWRRRLAEQRRQNLRDGTRELFSRQMWAKTVIRRRSKERSDRYAQQVNAPMAEDVSLTSDTIRSTMLQPQSGPLPDPGREERLAKAARNVKDMAAKQSTRRMEALHELYMNARSFITTTEQLDVEIERVFTARPFEHVYGKGNMQSIWDAKGSPATVNEMLQAINNTQKTTMAFNSGPSIPTGKRMKKLAEELAGGKMD